MSSFSGSKDGIALLLRMCSALILSAGAAAAGGFAVAAAMRAGADSACDAASAPAAPIKVVEDANVAAISHESAMRPLESLPVLSN